MKKSQRRSEKQALFNALAAEFATNPENIENDYRTFLIYDDGYVMTVGTLRVAGSIWYGVAVCVPEDNFSKHTGFVLAGNRIIDQDCMTGFIPCSSGIPLVSQLQIMTDILSNVSDQYPHITKKLVENWILWILEVQDQDPWS